MLVDKFLSDGTLTSGEIAKYKLLMKSCAIVGGRKAYLAYEQLIKTDPMMVEFLIDSELDLAESLAKVITSSLLRAIEDGSIGLISPEHMRVALKTVMSSERRDIIVDIALTEPELFLNSMMMIPDEIPIAREILSEKLRHYPEDEPKKELLMDILAKLE